MFIPAARPELLPSCGLVPRGGKWLVRTLIEGGSRGRLDSEVGRDPFENDSAESLAPELLIEIRSVEGAPLFLGDHKIGRLPTELSDQFRGSHRRQSVRVSRRRVQGQTQKISQGNMDQHDGRTPLPVASVSS